MVQFGRILQAGQGPNLTPFRFAFNNPLKYSDFFGLFETESDAKDWAKENNIRIGLFSFYKLKQGSDGMWEINNYKKGVSYFRDQSNHKGPVLTMGNSFVVAAPIVSDYSKRSRSIKSSKDLMDAFSFGNSIKIDILKFATLKNELISRIEFDKLSKLDASNLTASALGSGGSRYLLVASTMGRAANNLGLLTAGYIYADNPTAGNGARLLIQSTATATTLIPGVGWTISIGISAADMMWGEDLYEFIDKK